MVRAIAKHLGRALQSAGAVACALSVLAAACDRQSGSGAQPAPSASAVPLGLTPELAGKVLAKVGDRTVTLGEYAAVLERMDRFERLRYQSPERRQLLLDEIIRAELLAAEARRRGLDRDPETVERIRQILRDELLRQVRAELPGPEQIPEAEVRSYYDEHRDEFREPERRRVATIELRTRQQAEQLLAKAQTATPAEWGRLVREHSAETPASDADSRPLELAGDRGIVSLGDHGGNPQVPEPVRQAVFKIGQVGQVLGEVVEADGRFHIVRLIGKTEARMRGYQDAQRSIRVTLVQQRVRDAEKKLEERLRKQHPVTVDEAALAKIDVPGVSASDAGDQGDGATP